MGGEPDFRVASGDRRMGRAGSVAPYNLNLFAALTDVSENGIDALLVDRPQSL